MEIAKKYEIWDRLARWKPCWAWYLFAKSRRLRSQSAVRHKEGSDVMLGGHWECAWAQRSLVLANLPLRNNTMCRSVSYQSSSSPPLSDEICHDDSGVWRSLELEG
jgi:hypothetical protein